MMAAHHQLWLAPWRLTFPATVNPTSLLNLLQSVFTPTNLCYLTDWAHTRQWNESNRRSVMPSHTLWPISTPWPKVTKTSSKAYLVCTISLIISLGDSESYTYPVVSEKDSLVTGLLAAIYTPIQFAQRNAAGFLSLLVPSNHIPQPFPNPQQ